MPKLYRHLKAVKLVEYKIPRSYGHLSYNGFALFDTKRNELISMGENEPYIPAGGRKAILSIVESGLIGLPTLFISSKEQREAIHEA